MNDQPELSIKREVMDAIKNGRVHMRPRWHFVLLSVLFAIAVAIVVIILLYVVSLFIFILHDTGAWFVPAFGGRGWFSFIRSVPWLLIALSLVFVGLLEIFLRRYALIYRKPLLVSLLGVIIVITAGGFLVASTPLHRQLYWYARHNELPPPFQVPYNVFRQAPAPDVYHGTIVAETSRGFVMVDENGAGTTTVVVDRMTRLPNGADFEIGTDVVVLGDANGPGTVRAFGVQEDAE